MRLTRLKIQNFRCFEQFELDLHPNLTVLIAPNGAGKTTLLDAARIAVWPFVKAFDLGGQTGKSATIQPDDVRRLPLQRGVMEPVLPSSIEASGFWPELNTNTTKSEALLFSEADLQCVWLQTREKIKKGTNTLGDKGTKGLTQLGKAFQASQFNSLDSIALSEASIGFPVISYLGTGRLWYQGRYSSQVKDKKLEQDAFSRSWGYRDCLTASSAYKQFEDWFGWIYRSYREKQIEALERSTSIDSNDQWLKDSIDVVVKAVDEVVAPITGWGKIAYSSSNQQQIVLSHKEHGIMPLSMLSDGLRNTIVMVADIAFRCSKLNPHLGARAALDSYGVIMIDEVDMFLHPEWQQQILGALRRAFPKIQFIVTTHSPQVLTTVPKECIRLIDGDRAVEPSVHTLGEESRTVLEDVMHVSSRPRDEYSDLLTQYLKKINRGDIDSTEVLQMRAGLERHYGANHDQLQLANTRINYWRAVRHTE
ncbi:AAA family ATPase [Oceanospirillum beijerinckii]|uniref:AAA family ATPase n=1 Tax=Oceanospirillum beijerinckii TaxID=64976 RepID=UPI0004277D03|nr:AAA family ATPase [Oceanospirillum beijerinckii]